jgi:ABC-2 type transport system ATP-binding protein
MNVVEIKNLTKDFNELRAVDSISFNVEEGEIFGFLGPNGAGKTTTLSMLSTLLEPSSGEATVNGFNIKTDRDNVRKSIGIVFQDPSLDDELTAYENMDFHGWLYNVPREVRKKKIPELLNMVELEDRKDHFVKTFSGGMKRRLEIARGLLHEPKVLFLDEPTLGLDPQTRNHIWDYIKKLNEEKHTTIILTTHYMEEADRLCNRVAIVDHGKIVAMNTSEKLKETIGGDVITLESPDAKKIISLIEKLPWFKSSKEHDGFVTISVAEANKNVVELMALLCKSDVRLLSLRIHNPTLEDVFLYYTGKTIREQEASSSDAMRMRRRMSARR